jgi:hypothetical protein
MDRLFQGLEAEKSALQLGLVIDRADGQITLEFLEGLSDFGELEIMFPEQGGIVFGEVGAKQVAAFPTPGHA